MRRFLVVGAVNVLAIALLLEITLRLFPALIPHPLLYFFEPDLRAEIAQGKLPTVNDTVLLDRDDGGFPLRVWKPGVSIKHDFDDPGTVKEVRMDAQGFCNPPPANSTSLLAPDLISIGDSFTWCMSVEPSDTWTSQLAGLTGFSTYNLGKDGIGLYEYLQILKQFGLQQSPRYVVMNVYEGNDLRDAQKYASYYTRYDRGEATEQKADIADVIYRFFDEGELRRHSYVVNLLASLVTYTSRSLTPKPDFRYQISTQGTSIVFNPENSDADEVKSARRLDAQEIDLGVFDVALESFAALSVEHGFIPIITYSPSAYTVYREYVTFSDPGLFELMDRYSRRQRTYFVEKTGELGIQFLDLTLTLQAVAPHHLSPENLLYYPTNLHYTRWGHLAVANALADFFQPDDLPLCQTVSSDK